MVTPSTVTASGMVTETGLLTWFAIFPVLRDLYTTLSEVFQKWDSCHIYWILSLIWWRVTRNGHISLLWKSAGFHSVTFCLKVFSPSHTRQFFEQLKEYVSLYEPQSRCIILDSFWVIDFLSAVASGNKETRLNIFHWYQMSINKNRFISRLQDISWNIYVLCTFGLWRFFCS